MDFMAMVHAKMQAHADDHLARVAEASKRSEERRRARNNAKAHRSYARKSTEEKLELSRRKKARMRELHGDGYYYEQNRAWVVHFGWHHVQWQYTTPLNILNKKEQPQ